MTQRHQNGTLRKAKRKDGPVWELLFRERGSDGRLIQRTHVIGPVKEFTERAAMLEIEALRSRMNREVRITPISRFEELVDNYRGTEMLSENKTAKTRGTYESYLKHWILPRWGKTRLADVKPVAMETWLRSLGLANGSKAKIRNIMSAIYRHAIRSEFTEKNPITTVRQSAKREKLPVILESTELRKLFAVLGVRERTMVIADSLTGLRRGELFGLKWEDVDFLNMQVRIVRSYVDGHEGKGKTEASRKPVPIQECIAQALLDWRQESTYAKPGDWIFASVKAKGARPLWPGTIMRYFIQPAAKDAGIEKHFNWHTFRHTFSSLICSQGADSKIVQELLRHASIATTMNVYTQANDKQKRDAQNRLAGSIM